IDGLKLTSTTVLAIGKMAAVVRLAITNEGGHKRDVKLKLALRGGVTQSLAPWTNAFPPTESDNMIEIDEARRAMRFVARASSAVLLQGTKPPPQSVHENGLQFEFELAAGQSRSISFVGAIGETASEAALLFDEVIAHPETEIAHVRDEWNAE